MNQHHRVAVETFSRTVEITVTASVLATDDAVIDKGRRNAGVTPAVFARGEVLCAVDSAEQDATTTVTSTRAIADGGHATRTVNVPVETSSGECWHAPGGCGGHLVEQVEATAAELRGERGLRPCQSAPCQAAGIDAPVRCDGCGVSVFDPEAFNAARYCPECATHLHKHPSDADHDLYDLRDPGADALVTDGGTEPDTVYVAIGGQSPHKTLHVDPDCTQFKATSRVEPKDRDTYPDDHPVCDMCTGRFEPTGSGPSDAYKALQRAADD